jgi:urea transport system permease protein
VLICPRFRGIRRALRGCRCRPGIPLVLLLFWSLVAALLLLTSAPSAAAATGFEQGIDLLGERSFKRKAEAVDLIAESGDPRAARLLSGLLDGDLYLLKEDRSPVYAEREGREYLVTHALTGEQIGRLKRRALKRITINNLLRSQLKGTIAELHLAHSEPAVRLEAVNAMLERPEPGHADLLRRKLDGEADPQVRSAMQTAIALADLGSSDQARLLAAIEELRGNLHPTVRNALNRLLERQPQDPVRQTAVQALQEIESRVRLFGVLETLFFGLSLGSVLVLAAIGLAITFGVMGVINMAHGELIMLGAYTTYVIQQLMPGHIGASILVSVPAAFLVAGLTGVLIERTVIRFLYGRPLETLLATFGISLVLQQTVRTIFSPLNRSVETPDWMSGALEVNQVLFLTYNRLYIILFSLLVFAALFLVLKRTPLGLQVRAVSQNRAMAQAMGVRAQWVDAMTFGLGSGIAGVAGVALSQLTNVGPNLGQSYIVDSFMVVVFGGVGNLWGTLVGGLSLGVANKFLEPWSGAVLAKILVLVFIILFIQKRPRGLFPQKGRAAEGS